MDSVLNDPRVEKLMKEFLADVEASRDSKAKIRQALTASNLIYKAVRKRGKPTR
jgi:hypothetical protein